jgi:histone H3/H4
MRASDLLVSVHCNRLFVCCAQDVEDFLVHMFEDCNLCAIHAKRITISE